MNADLFFGKTLRPALSSAAFRSPSESSAAYPSAGGHGEQNNLRQMAIDIFITF